MREMRSRGMAGGVGVPGALMLADALASSRLAALARSLSTSALPMARLGRAAASKRTADVAPTYTRMA